ncbi:MAG TPA: hypothetical protein VMV83_10535 [Rectinemataceae bacterium]|nr:hypothetical protein [Rectinemataceae bacterium]
MRRSGRRAILALAVMLGFASGSALAAQEVSSWFDRSPDAAAYAAVKQDLLALAARSISGMHSDRPLAERLAEGARKRVAPDRLLAALGTETDRLLSAAAEIDKRGLLPTDSRSAGTMMAQVGIALRAGLEPNDIGAAFDGASARLGVSPAARDRALAVISAMTGLSLDAKQRSALIAALAASQLPTVRFRGVRGALAELLARHLTPEQATQSLIDSFSAQATVSVEPRREREGDSVARPSAGGGSSHEGEGGGGDD